MTTPDYCQALAGGQVNVTIRQVAGAGHWLPVEAAAAVSALLLDFIQADGRLATSQ